MKEVVGHNPRISMNRKSATLRIHPCPESKQNDLKGAFEYFKMI